MFTRAWLLNAFHVVAFAFLTTFVGGLAAAGLQVFSLSTVHAAAIAGLAAAVVALQGLLAAPVSPPSSSTPYLHVAVAQRVVYAARSTLKAPAVPEPPLTRAEFLDGLREVLAEARQTQPPFPGNEPVSFTPPPPQAG